MNSKKIKRTKETNQCAFASKHEIVKGAHVSFYIKSFYLYPTRGTRGDFLLHRWPGPPFKLGTAPPPLELWHLGG